MLSVKERGFYIPYMSDIYKNKESVHKQGLDQYGLQSKIKVH